MTGVIVELRCVQLTELSTADLGSAGLDTGMAQPEEDRLYRGGKLIRIAVSYLSCASNGIRES